MGCDIHVHAEIKIEGIWYHYSQPDIRRWYNLFTKLANVRCYGEPESNPIAQDKGLPKDISLITAIEAKHWDSDGHSHSFMNAKEIKELHDWVDKQELKGMDYYNWCHGGWLFGNSWSMDSETLPKEVTDIRWVFWFDN